MITNRNGNSAWLKAMRDMETEPNEPYTPPRQSLADFHIACEAELFEAALRITKMAGTKGPCAATESHEDSEAQRSVGEVRGETVLTYSGPDWFTKRQAE